MQFVNNGPDIPDSLLMAHEEGRVVFFCGAGISRPAGLPGFQGLVDEIYRRVDTVPTPIEQGAYDRDQFDATLDLLERRLPGQRIKVRKALSQALTPKMRRNGASDTHIALLQLAHSREGALRLVTTNFDKIFDKIAKRRKLAINTYAAPMLPIPKVSRWNGLVYLHGVLPEINDENALHRLVLTSGDFGLAYLTERWASRFVSELFRNYIVCFVGYSINDPVLRYMIDALAADRMMGEVTHEAFAFGDYEPGKNESKAREWEAKGVIPILYETPTSSNHSALHNTLKAWAETYRDGIFGKERIVADLAMAHPSSSTRQDDFIGRMIWALTDKSSSLPMKRFADFNPVPPIEWLDVFFERRFRHADLIRFGVPPLANIDDKLGFSFICRPTPYTHASWMNLFSGGYDNKWDETMSHLARWLVRHIGDSNLILWMDRNGGQLHQSLRYLIEKQLIYLDDLEKKENRKELESLLINAPNSIPTPSMKRLWYLFLMGGIKSWQKPDFYTWSNQLNRNGLTSNLRLELRQLLAPKIRLKKPFRWPVSDNATDNLIPSDHRIDCELELAVDSVYAFLDVLGSSNIWRQSLPILIEDFQLLLSDALDLMRDLEKVNDRSDSSYWDLPSITPHWQNRKLYDWVALIELLRDSWLAVHKRVPIRAARIAESWFEKPYPTFKRLALFAASQNEHIAPDQWVKWLLIDDAWWLWSVESQRETMRLLVLQGEKLTSVTGDKLEAAILNGPPRDMFSHDLQSESFQDVVNRLIWLRLVKLREGGKTLGKIASERITELSSNNPDWIVGSHERDEFPHWSSGTGDPDYEKSLDIDFAPRKRRDLVEWLRKSRSHQRPFYEDTWSKVCRIHPLNCFYALYDLAQQAEWPEDRWRTALQIWSDKRLIRRSWQYVAPLLQTMPDHVLLGIIYSVSGWLKSISQVLDGEDAIFVALCGRILALSHEGEDDSDEPLFNAINHPIGHVTEALLNFCFNRGLNDNDKLPNDIESLFTKLCDPAISHYRYSRVILASRLIALFRVDRTWVENHLLPLFDWNSDTLEAKVAWEGFMWSPRLYPPLMIAFKDHFLSTAKHYDELSKHGRQFPSFLTFAALMSIDGYSQLEFRLAIEALPRKGLEEVIRTLVQAAEESSGQREEYWKNRIRPFWQSIWPKSNDLVTETIASLVAKLCITNPEEFPIALFTLIDWLRPIEHPDFIVHKLYESGLPDRFPNESFRFLSTIIDHKSKGARELTQCLDVIARVSPSLKQNSEFNRLRAIDS